MNWMKPWITRICVAGKLGLLTLAACAAQQGSVPRAVDLTATDGTKLKATFFSAGKAGPGALLLHQCSGQRKGWDALAAQLATAGISVLSLDYRGYGDSEGKVPKDLPQAEGMKVLNEKWPSDLDVAYNYLVFQAGINAKMVGAGGGASCGVNLAIHLAERHPEVKSLVLLSGNADRQGRTFF